MTAELTKKKNIWTIYGVIAVLILLVLLSVLLVGSPVQLTKARRAATGNLVAQLQTAYLNYHVEYDAYPEGTENSRLIKVLEGDNPRKIEFLTLKPSDLNSSGEIMDTWGTPFKIAAGSDSNIRVISVGPDKIIGTPDDITNP